jgi:hypothetical protein
VILRRVTEHVRTQNWFAVGLDFGIVVIGVFVGIQVSNWNQERVGAEQQQRYLERLESDFASIKQRIDGHFATFEQVIGGADYLLELMRMPEEDFRSFEVNEQRLDHALSNLTNTRIPPGRSATYVEMLSTSQLSAVGNASLRDKLAEYDRMADIHLEVFRSTVAQNSSQIPIVYRHYKVATALDEEALSGIKIEMLSYDLEAMRNDPQFEVAVMILGTNARNNYGVRRAQGGLTDEILRLLKARDRS